MTAQGPIVQPVSRFTIRHVIDMAHRVCRLPAQAITSEMISTARDHLFLWVSQLPNQGSILSAQSKYVVGMNQGITSVLAPYGVIDVLNANYRTTTRVPGEANTATSGVVANAFDGDVATVCTVTGAGNIQTEFESPTVLTTIGVLPSVSDTWNVQLQNSTDGINWVTACTNPALTVADSQWFWLDVEGMVPSSFARLVVTPTLAAWGVRELYWGNAPNEIPMYSMNKDDYWSLPNKAFAGRPLQYWYDKQVRPVINLWPAPDSSSQFAQLVLLTKRHLLDFQSMTVEVELPTVWFDALVDNLALRIARVTPEVQAALIPDIRAAAANSLAIAWSGDTDRTTMQIMPDISPYTR